MKVAIAGYGNLAMNVEREVLSNDNTELVGIFTRRNIRFVRSEEGTPVYSFDLISKLKSKIDVVLNCMGSANDLPVITAYLAGFFNVVDAYDNSIFLSEHIRKTNRYALQNNKLALVGCGICTLLTDLLSTYFDAFCSDFAKSDVKQEGVSPGHTNAVKDIEGVANAVVYIDSQGIFDCYVVAEGSDKLRQIENEIRSLPGYFKNCNTKISFIDSDTFIKMHKVRTFSQCFKFNDKTDEDEMQLNCSFSTSDVLDTTAKLMISFANAVFEMNKEGKSGCITMLDVPPKYLVCERLHLSAVDDKIEQN